VPEFGNQAVYYLDDDAIGIAADWPAAVTYCADCMGLE
jgi:hypothetical protein